MYIQDKRLVKVCKKLDFHQNNNFSKSVHGYPTTRCVKYGLKTIKWDGLHVSTV